jgi:hypothetical protein
VAGTDFSWALFMDHEGQLHVAGPSELFSCLQAWDKVRSCFKTSHASRFSNR